MIKYAFNTNEQGQLQYVGRIVEETADSITLNVYNAMALIWFGSPEESDELQTVPRAECRIFVSETAMLDAARIAFRRHASPNVTFVTVD